MFRTIFLLLEYIIASKSDDSGEFKYFLSKMKHLAVFRISKLSKNGRHSEWEWGRTNVSSEFMFLANSKTGLVQNGWTSDSNNGKITKFSSLNWFLNIIASSTDSIIVTNIYSFYHSINILKKKMIVKRNIKTLSRKRGLNLPHEASELMESLFLVRLP